MANRSRVIPGLAAALVLIALVAGAVLAEVPQKINYQMRIVDTDTGEPLPGSHNVVFRIFDSDLVGSSLWTESHSVTADTAGVVSVILGSTTPIDISLDGSRWLEVEVDTEVLTPRRELVSVPYALKADIAGQAANADSLGGMAASSFLTDGHSLDADDGDPVDVVYVDSSGRVGIGTTSPDYALHVRGDQDDGTEVVIENSHDGNQGWQGLSFRDESDFDIGIRAYEFDDPTYPSDMSIYNYRINGGIRFNTGGSDHVTIDHNGRLGIDEQNPSQELDVNGDIEARRLYLGNETSAGVLYLRDAASSTSMIEMFKTSAGGRIDIRSIDGSINTSLESDIHSGGGGFLQIKRKPSYAGFTVDGNYNGTEGTRVTIVGDGASTTFDMSKTGNASVVLPGNSISATEILDEPGVASARTHYTPSTALQMVNGFNTLASRSITTPASGYVLVLGSAQPTVTHGAGTSQAEFGVSDASSSFPENQDCLLMIDGVNPAGTYTFPITVHGLFIVPGAGTYTYYFLGKEYTGAYTANDVQFTLVYFPTNHGTVSPTFAEGGEGDLSVEAEGTVFSKEEEIARERADEERAHRERVEREMAEMRAQIEALQREMETDPNSRPR